LFKLRNKYGLLASNPDKNLVMSISCSLTS
jgi:hypothetical protein